MKRIAVLCFLLGAWASAEVRGAAPQVEASLRPDSVLIGDRFTLEVEVRKDMMQVVGWPAFQQGRMNGQIEILSESPVDTVASDGRQQTLRKRYELTSFDAGAYDLGRFPVLYTDKNIVDTLYSAEPLRIVVTTFPVDTQNSTVYDIKAPEETPLLVSEFGGYVARGVLGALLVAALAILGWRWWSRRRVTAAETGGEPLPAVPPHERAIQDLETLHNQKLWQSGKVKQYYTRLTDIVRLYLEGRYGIRALEQTSDEIVRELRTVELADRYRGELRDLFRTADLVKFAKHQPSAEENDAFYYTAYYFVENTKRMPEEEANGKTDAEDEQK